MVGCDMMWNMFSAQANNWKWACFEQKTNSCELYRSISACSIKLHHLPEEQVLVPSLLLHAEVARLWFALERELCCLPEQIHEHLICIGDTQACCSTRFTFFSHRFKKYETIFEITTCGCNTTNCGGPAFQNKHRVTRGSARRDPHWSRIPKQATEMPKLAFRNSTRCQFSSTKTKRSP